MTDVTGQVAGPLSARLRRVPERLEHFETRIALLSPPRTGSTLVARLLWQLPEITHHCHEPFEAVYWGGAGADSAAEAMLHPMEIATGKRVPAASIDGGGLLIKEMTFQLGSSEARFVAYLATRPVVLVVRDPRLSTTSRLRIIKEISNADTFPPVEGGWQALDEQVRLLRSIGVPYVIVDSDRLRTDPQPVLAELAVRTRLSSWPVDPSWQPRRGLQLCTPEVATLMGEKRALDDPFYRRALSSTGIQPVDAVNWDHEESQIARAGLTEHVAEWMEIYRRLLDDEQLVRGGSIGRAHELG